MPSVFERVAAQAKARQSRRAPNPGVRVIVREAGSYALGSPHDDVLSWEAMVGEALGTASPSVRRIFLQQLASLAPKSWDARTQTLTPDPLMLSAALAILASTKPKNEIEACGAAQMVAMHMITMRASQKALEGGGLSVEYVREASRAARTFAMQLDSLSRSRGKIGRQKITVRNERHIHQHQHLHHHQAEGDGGVIDISGQPHGQRGSNRRPSREAQGLPGGEHHGLAQMRGEDQSRGLLSVASPQGSEALPDTRRSRGLGCAEGGAER